MKCTITFLLLIVAICSMGCADKQIETNNNNNLASIIKEEYENIKYQAITTSENECCIQKISLKNASVEQCERIVIPDQIKDYKVTKISGITDDEDGTQRNVFGDVQPVDGGALICKEGPTKSENIVKEIIIPDTVLKLERDCFSGLNSLTHVTLSKTLQSFGGNVFCDTPNLLEIEIPATVTEGVEYLTGKKWDKFIVDSNNTEYQITDGLLLSKDGTILYGIVPNNNSITIPENVVDLAKNSLETDYAVDINVEPENRIYGQEGQCIYKKENGELVCAISKNGKVVLSDCIKKLNTPIMVSGANVKKIVYTAKEPKPFSIQTIEEYEKGNGLKWRGNKISSNCTWDIRGRDVPSTFAPTDFGMGKIVVLEKDKKKYDKWLEKHRKWGVVVDIVTK